MPPVRELLIVSGYTTLIDSIREVCDDVGISPFIIEWEQADRHLIDRLARHSAEHGEPDVIIGRGAVASLVERSFANVVVLRAEPDDVDYLEVITRAASIGPNVGILLYEPHAYAFKTEVLRRTVGLNELRVYPVSSKDDIKSMIVAGKRDGMNAMVGGGILGKCTGEAMGFPVLFVETGKRSIRLAISQAIAVIEARRGEKRQLDALKTVVSSVQEGIMTLCDGRITLVNEILAGMLHLPHEKIPEDGKAPLALKSLDPILVRFIRQEKTAEEILRVGSLMLFCKKVVLSEHPARHETMLICRNVTEIQQQERKIRRQLHASGVTARFQFGDIIGESPALRSVIARARTFAGTDANILIHGESGTGKELFAQSIHNASARRNRPFVAVNCAAIPETLLESELFGYEEGAFSGARRSGKLGLFELAHEGTIFLDEINSLPIALQGVLLRVIQEKQVRKVGSQSVISIDTRIISATNSDIGRLIGENAFRQDLYYRLNTLNLRLPPLVERREDLPPLAGHFLALYAAKYGARGLYLTDADKALILTHSWPGNVRELENVIHRFVVLSKTGGVKSVRECFDTPGEATVRRAGDAAGSLTVARGTLAEIEREVIAHYLEECRWNKQAAADKLGICRASLWRKMKTAAL